MENLVFSINATLPVFLVMAIGWGLRRLGFLPPAFCTAADKLVFKVTLPVMLLCDMASVDLVHDFDGKYVAFMLDEREPCLYIMDEARYVKLGRHADVSGL